VDRYAAALREFGARRVDELFEPGPAAPRENGPERSASRPESEARVGGIVAACRQLRTRKGDRMAVFTLEDAQGSVEIVVFPEAYQRAASLIETGTLVLVRGKLERDEDTARIVAAEIAPLDSVRERIAREVAIHFSKPADRGTLETLGRIFSRHRGEGKVSFEVETGDPPHRLRVKVDVGAEIRVRPSSSLVAEVEQVVGQGAVELR
jgi:DNA polymerase-3 subunit alpha